MNLSKEKVKYICETDAVLGITKFYKRVYLSELEMWGAKKNITKRTFDKRKGEGCKVEYYKSTIDVNIIRGFVKDIDSLIDEALRTRDEKWFIFLTRKRNLLMNILN